MVTAYFSELFNYFLSHIWKGKSFPKYYRIFEQPKKGITISFLFHLVTSHYIFCLISHLHYPKVFYFFKNLYHLLFVSIFCRCLFTFLLIQKAMRLYHIGRVKKMEFNKQIIHLHVVLFFTALSSDDSFHYKSGPLGLLQPL